MKNKNKNLFNVYIQDFVNCKYIGIKGYTGA